MPQHWRTVRVFISSTFRDMHAERDHLVTVVFPELRERCERLGLEFFDVDLRWGVPASGVDGERANSWAYCKQWIDRVEPFFVCILGQRYGWTPPASEIDDPTDRAAYAGLSITEMEVRHAVLSQRLRRWSFFYFREASVPVDVPPEIYTRFVDPADQARLRRLKEEIRQTGRPIRSYACRWTGTDFSDLEAFGQLVLEDLWAGVLRDARYVAKEVWQTVRGHDPATDPLYTEESQPIPQQVWERLIDHAKPPPRDPLDAEAEEMAAFAAPRLRWFRGRQRELRELAEFMGDLPPEASRLCVVRGAPGQGKSALLAKFLADLSVPALGSRRSPLVISHFVGATERSADVRALLEQLVKECDRLGVPQPAEEEPKEDLGSLRNRLVARLDSYDGPYRLVLLIDGINQLTGGHLLAWLPQALGPQVRIILSCVLDPTTPAMSPEARLITALQRRRPAPRWVDLAPLDEADARGIVQDYLQECCKELDPPQIDVICRMEQARNPLYLLLMLHQLRTLGGDDMHRKVPGIIADLRQTRPDTVSLFDWVLERLEVFGAEAVRLWCTYLALGRVGMASRELRDLLTRKLGGEAVLAALRIERGLRRYLQHRGAQWDFFHQQLREAVTRRYLPADPTPLHTNIANYLETQWRDQNPHALSELPYHQAEARLGEELTRTLTDFGFMYAKLSAFGPHRLIEDYDLASLGAVRASIGKMKSYERSLRLIQGALRLSAHVVSQDTTQLAGQLLGRLPCFEEPEIQAMLSQAKEWRATPWLRPLTPGLISPGGPLLRTFAGHKSWVTAVAVTPDGRRVVSGSLDQTLKVWDLQTGAEVCTLEGHGGQINALAITPDGRMVLSASEDRTIHMWDIETGSKLRTLEGRHDKINALAVAPDCQVVLSGSEDGTLTAWDLETGAELRTLEGHTSGIETVAVLPERLFSSTMRGREQLFLFQLPQEGVSCDGLHAVSGSTDQTLKVWDLGTGVEVRTLKGHTSGITAVAVTPDGRQAVSASGDRTINVWDLGTGTNLRTLMGHRRSRSNVTYALAITPDGRMLISASEDSTIRGWDLETGAELFTLEGHAGEVLTVVVTPDGRHAVSGSMDCTLKVWDLETGPQPGIQGGHADRVSAVAVAPDGRHAVSAGAYLLKVWNPETGEELRSLKGHHYRVSAVAVTPDSRRAVSGSEDGTLKLWDLETGVELRTMSASVDLFAINAVAVTPDGRRVVSATTPLLTVWDLATGAEERNLEGHISWVNAVAVTPDSRRAVSAGDYTLKVWDLETGEVLRNLEGHAERVLTVAVTLDGRSAVSGSADLTLKIWNLDTGEERRTLKGHTGPVKAVAITPDGQYVVSGSADPILGSGDPSLNVWHMQTGEVIAVFAGDGPFETCAVASDGVTIVAGDQLGHVHFLRLEGLE